MKKIPIQLVFIFLLLIPIFVISLEAQTMLSQSVSSSKDDIYEKVGAVLPKDAFNLESNFWRHNFLAMPISSNALFTRNFSTEISKNIYSHSLALMIFATATRGNTQPFSLEKQTLTGYNPAYITGSSMRWFTDERLFAVDNNAFFGIEFNTFFPYNNGVIRIGDSSEKAFVILVSLASTRRFR